MNARRGFTLIETMMAASLGALLVLACLAMFGAMDRTEAATARRYDEATSMARMHLVMDRVFGDMLIQGADMTPAASNSRGSRNSSLTVRAVATSSFQAAESKRNEQVQAQPRPRVSLDTDLGSQVKGAMQRAGMRADGSAPQRLEVVTTKSPIPAGYGGISTAEMQASLDALGTMASRSAFELRPDAATPPDRLNPGEKLPGDGKGWTLWWRPLDRKSVV